MSHSPEPSREPAPHRRNVLQWVAAVSGGLATLALGIPIVGYILGTLIKPQAKEWIDLGPLEDFPEKQTRLVDFILPHTQKWDGECRKASAYVRRMEGEQFQVFAINCAHLGCPVSWFPASGLFMCPCHGGVYYQDGSHASGPPPRGLYEYDFEITAQRTLRIKVGQLPTLNDPLRKPTQGGKA